MIPLNKGFPDDIIDLSFLKEIKPESLTKDDGVIKYLVKAGKDIVSPLQPPKKGATTKVKYEGRKLDGDLLTKPELRRITLFTDNMIEGLHLAIASMKIGEIAWYKFSPSYHYFNEKITNAIQQEIDIDKTQSLFYKIELIDYKNNENNTYEGRLEHYAYCRMKGNESFKENKYEEAFKHYEIGLNFLRNFPKKLKENMTESQNKEIEDYSLKLFTNGVICKVKLHKWYEGIKLIDEALKIHSSNINAAKLWYNKGFCHYNVNEHEKAIEAFDKVLELEPNNQEALSMKSKFNKSKIDEKTREKITCKLILENMAEEEEKEKKLKKLKRKIEESNKMKEEMQNDDDFDEEQAPKISISDLEKGIIIDANDPKTILGDEDEMEEDILKN